MSKMDLKYICRTALGVALFVALSLCLQVPIFENYYVCLGYLVMAVYLQREGLVSGTIVGTFGVVLYCILISGLRGMPGWVVGNLVIGINLGLTMQMLKEAKRLLWYSMNILVIILSVLLGILVLKSFTECLLYSQPMLIRMGKNIYPTVADIITLILSLPFCDILNTRLHKAKVGG